VGGGLAFPPVLLRTVHTYVENVVARSLRYGRKLMGKRKRKPPAPAKFKVGDRVRVKHGITDVE
jgi:hypothetical protein